MNYDPIQGEFFSSQSIADRLVRESIQNSLDARAGTEQPVRIRFTLRDRDGLSAERAGAYFNGLLRHLDAAMEDNAPGRVALERLGDGQRVPYLLIEDFNTTGLIGDVEQFSDPSISGGSDDNHFYWFVRNVGRSGKRGLEGGSWGVGKWVFPDASAINTFFLLTLRQDDQRAIFMGQSVLKMHTLGRARYFPYGHFAEIEPDSEFALPIGAPVEIHRVSEDFGLTRAGEPGLSIMVPFPEEGLDRDSILRAVIRYYFSPILSDRLLVEVSDSSSGDQGIRVDYDTIYDIIDDIDWSDSGTDLTPENRRRMFDLVQDHATVSGQDMITTREPEPNRDPTRTSFSDKFETDLLEEARSRYELGEALTFRIPVWVHPKNDSPRLSRFDLIVQRDVNQEGTHTEYVRNNLTIPEADPDGWASPPTSGLSWWLTKGIWPRCCATRRSHLILGGTSVPRGYEITTTSGSRLSASSMGPFAALFGASRLHARVCTETCSVSSSASLTMEGARIPDPGHPTLRRRARWRSQNGGADSTSELSVRILCHPGNYRFRWPMKHAVGALSQGMTQGTFNLTLRGSRYPRMDAGSMRYNSTG